MAQTTYLGIMLAPSGHRLVTQHGIHAFAAAGTTITLTIRMKRLVAAQFSPNQVTSSTKTAMIGAYLPYVSAAQVSGGVYNTSRKLVVQRQGGGIAGLKFSYSLVGY